MLRISYLWRFNVLKVEYGAIIAWTDGITQFINPFSCDLNTSNVQNFCCRHGKAKILCVQLLYIINDNVLIRTIHTLNIHSTNLTESSK